MKTYPLIDNDGFQFGFEIDNAYVSINKISKLISSMTSVSDIRKRRLFDFHSSYHMEFIYSGNQFVVLEPFGDNSRYWICPKNKAVYETSVVEIEDIFKKYKPPLLIKLYGDLLTLNFKGFFKC